METITATDKAQNTKIRKYFSVGGMTCASCAVSVESMLKAQPGVLDAKCELSQPVR